MDSRYYLIRQDGTVEEADRSMVLGRLKELKKNDIGVQVIFGVRGVFSPDGGTFKCGPEIYKLEDPDEDWSATSKEWKDKEDDDQQGSIPNTDY